MEIFLNPEHIALRDKVSSWAAMRIVPHAGDDRDLQKKARALLRLLSEEGLVKYLVPQSYGGVHPALDVRSICVVREHLAYFYGLADVVFVMQGLGSYPITLEGREEVKRQVLPRVAKGEAIAAFAITEPDAGSDLAALRTTARKAGSLYELNGTKTFITNAGLADFYTVFAKTAPELGSKGISAFVVERDTPGLTVPRSIELIDGHPVGELRFEACRIPEQHLLGKEGGGFKLAMQSLDLFRCTVGAAALGMAQRAFDEAVAYSQQRIQFGRPLSDLQAIQFKLAEMATQLDAARLLVYHAAWKKDTGSGRVTLEASMAKLYATEAAQKIIDEAVQIHGGYGLIKGATVERLYREIRALRIYEGTSEIQKLVIANQLLKERPTE